MTPTRKFNARPSTERVRLARNPEKACKTCFRVFPNTDQHFARGKRSKLTSTCKDCYQDAKPSSAAHDKRVRCIICHEPYAVTDTKANTTPEKPMMLCRRCLVMVSMALSVVDDGAYRRLIEYVEWRRTYPKLQ